MREASKHCVRFAEIKVVIVPGNILSTPTLLAEFLIKSSPKLCKMYTAPMDRYVASKTPGALTVLEIAKAPRQKPILIERDLPYQSNPSNHNSSAVNRDGVREHIACFNSLEGNRKGCGRNSLLGKMLFSSKKSLGTGVILIGWRSKQRLASKCSRGVDCGSKRDIHLRKDCVNKSS